MNECVLFSCEMWVLPTTASPTKKRASAQSSCFGWFHISRGVLASCPLLCLYLFVWSVWLQSPPHPPPPHHHSDSTPPKKVTATVSRWGAANSLSRGGDERYTRKLRRMGSASEVHYIKSRCVVQCDCSCSVTHSICSLARTARGGGPRWESSLPGG